MKKIPNILIVGSTPYNSTSQSRAMGSYFGYWEDRENAAQIYSNSEKPSHGHCKTFYQITDKMMLDARLKFKKCIGRIIYDKDLDSSIAESANKSNEKKHLNFKSRIVTFISNHKTPLVKLLRKWLWKKKTWDTQELEKWIDDFNPDIVYLAFSNDFFLLEIAYYISLSRKIPMVTVIGDDYYFNNHFSLSPFYYLYRCKYKKMVRTIFKENIFAFFNSPKILSKYSQYKKFPYLLHHSDVLYISSDMIQSKEQHKGEISSLLYTGNLALGRYKTIIEIGSAIYSINKNYCVDVYAPCYDQKILSKLKNAEGVLFHGSVSYEMVIKKIHESQALLFVENFSNKNANLTAYSLSTKISDYLKSGVPVFAYGPLKAGAIEYLVDNGCAYVCCERKELKSSLISFISDSNIRGEITKRALLVADKNHSKNAISLLFYNTVCDLVSK